MGWQQQKDVLHKERKQIMEDLKPGMFSKDQMNMRDCGGEQHLENKRVEDYDKWKTHNSKKMERFHEINREFKKQGEESLPHSLDDIRPGGKMKFY